MCSAGYRRPDGTPASSDAGEGRGVDRVEVGLARLDGRDEAGRLRHVLLGVVAGGGDLRPEVRLVARSGGELGRGGERLAPEEPTARDDAEQSQVRSRAGQRG